MKRRLALGAWYAVAIAGLIAAEDFRVTKHEANVVKEPDPFGEPVAVVKFGDTVTTTGDEKDEYLPITGPGGVKGWISRTDLIEPADFKAGAAGGDAAKAGQEGAYVKGFDPEVEGKARADNPSLDKVYREEVLPWVWETRGSRDLEEAEEEAERLQIQAQPIPDSLKGRIESLRLAAQPARDKWQAELREFRKKGQIGEFAGRK